MARRARRNRACHARGLDRLAAARLRRPWLRSLLSAERRDAHLRGDDGRRKKRHQPSRPRLPAAGRGLLQMTSANAPLGVYVHWPFCKSKCPYCDFNSHVREGIDQERWRRALLKELDHAAREAPAHRMESIFFGGGTPSLMEP